MSISYEIRDGTVQLSPEGKALAQAVRQAVVEMEAELGHCLVCDETWPSFCRQCGSELLRFGEQPTKKIAGSP